MTQVAVVLLKTLKKAGQIKSAELKISSTIGRDGKIYCSVKGGTPYEASLFLECMQEMLDPIENPRYILARKSWLGFRKDYHAVPSIISANRKSAQIFADIWKRHVSKMKLVYTRNPQGRRTLLSARLNSISGGLQKRSERVSCWA
jgi:hypothetical protein